MRRALIGVAAALLVGVLVIGVAAAREKRDLVLDIGVLPAGPVATLGPGDVACQTPIGLPGAVKRVSLWLGPINYARGPGEIEIRRNGVRGLVMARADLPQRPIAAGWTTYDLDREVPGGIDVALCVRNEGNNLLELLGDFDTSSGLAPPRRFAGRVLSNPTRSTDGLVLNGVPFQGADLAALFPAEEPRSLLSRVPAAFRNAALFKPDGVGAWTYWLLLGLALVGAPVVLARALAETEDA